MNYGLDSTKLKIAYTPKGDYKDVKDQIRSDRAFFQSEFRTDDAKAIDSASSYLYNKLLNHIIPHWYNTPWDFNGHTDIPNEGVIACGYFVSTTLKHLGFNLNRYKMAQQAGLLEAKALQDNSKLQLFSGMSFEKLKANLDTTYTDGIYFVGLDNHVGYVLIHNAELYFLHSSYCDNKVVIELAEHSPCFSSNLYVFAEVTTNRDLIKKWIFNERLVVPTS